MDNIKKDKSKEEKLRELEFLFTSFLKKDIEFREDPVYQAIFAAIDRLNYQPFLTLDIVKDIYKHSPKVIEELKEGGKEDYIIGKTIGAKLRQLRFWGMLVVSEKPKIRRQKTFAVDEDVKEKLKEYIKELLNGKK